MLLGGANLNNPINNLLAFDQHQVLQNTTGGGLQQQTAQRVSESMGPKTPSQVQNDHIGGQNTANWHL